MDGQKIKLKEEIKMNENKIRKILTIITLIIIGVIIMLYQRPGYSIVAVIIPLGIAWVVCTIIIIWIWRV